MERTYTMFEMVNQLKAEYQKYLDIRHTVRDTLVDIINDNGGSLTSQDLRTITGLDCDMIRSLLTSKKKDVKEYYTTANHMDNGHIKIKKTKEYTVQTYALILPDGSIDQNQTTSRTVAVNRYTLI